MAALELFRSICMILPRVEEVKHFEIISFRVKKRVFATIDPNQDKASLKFSLEDQATFGLIDKSMIYPVPNKWGKEGWTTVELKKVNEDLLKELLSTAYQTVITSEQD